MPSIRYMILYGSEEDKKAPYFVRNPNKYPDIFPQPGIKIDCVSASLILMLESDWKLTSGREELHRLPQSHRRLDS